MFMKCKLKKIHNILVTVTQDERVVCVLLIGQVRVELFLFRSQQLVDDVRVRSTLRFDPLQTRTLSRSHQLCVQAFVTSHVYDYILNEWQKLFV